MICPKCGEGISDDEQACGYCGTVILAIHLNSINNQQHWTTHAYSWLKTNKSIAVFFFIVFLAVSAVIFIETTDSGDVFIMKPKIMEIKTASAVNIVTKGPQTVTSTFRVDSPGIYVTVLIKSAAIGALVQIEWRHESSDLTIATNETTTTKTSQYVLFSLNKPANGFLQGKYEARVLIGQVYQKSVYFEVK